VERAVDEGIVNFYSVAPELQNERLVDAFNEEYPDIKIRVLRGGGELPSRISAEIESGSKGADVFLYSDPAWFEKNAEHLTTLEGPTAESWPEEAWTAEGKAIVPSAYPFGMIVWNTDLFPDGFDSWDDMLAPEVKGKFGTRSDVTPSYAGYLEFLETTMGPEYLPDLGNQNPKFYPSAVPMTQAIASGEIGVANTSTPSVVLDLKQMGAPVDSAVPSPSLAIEWAAAVLAKAEHSYAARVFVDFMMSPAGQEALNGDELGLSPLDDVPGTLRIESIETLDTERYPPAVVPEWDAKLAEYFS